LHCQAPQICFIGEEFHFFAVGECVIGVRYRRPWLGLGFVIKSTEKDEKAITTNN